MSLQGFAHEPAYSYCLPRMRRKRGTKMTNTKMTTTTKNTPLLTSRAQQPRLFSLRPLPLWAQSVRVRQMMRPTAVKTHPGTMQKSTRTARTSRKRQERQLKKISDLAPSCIRSYVEVVHVANPGANPHIIVFEQSLFVDYLSLFFNINVNSLFLCFSSSSGRHKSFSEPSYSHVQRYFEVSSSKCMFYNFNLL